MIRREIAAVLDRSGRGMGHRPVAPSLSSVARSTVGIIPRAGEAVTETVDPGAIEAAFSITPFNGITSKSAPVRRAGEIAAHSQTSRSGKEALRCATHSVNSASIDSSRVAARTRTSIRRQMACAREAASRDPASSHCSKLLLSAVALRQKAFSKLASVWVAQEMLARRVVDEGLERLAVVGEVDSPIRASAIEA